MQDTMERKSYIASNFAGLLFFYGRLEELA